MVSIQRASKAELTLLKHYNLIINRLRDTEGKNCQTRGSYHFLLSYDYTKYYPTYFYYQFLYIISILHFLITRLTYFRVPLAPEMKKMDYKHAVFS